MKTSSWVMVGLLLGGPQVQADQPTQWALLVGIDRYQRSDVTGLNYAVADVKSLAATLKSACHIPEDNVFMLTSDQSGDNSPAKNNVAYRLDWLAKHVKPADTVFFFFSGHGIELDGNSYLMTCEADPRSASTLEETGVETKKLMSRLANIKSNRLLVLIDACRNDPHAGRGAGDNALGKGMARDLVVQRRPSGAAASSNSGPLSATLFACSPGQRSYEWDQQRHGFFTYYLIQGLRGQAADGKGQVTVAGLSSYLGKTVGRSTERNAPAAQVPWMQAQGDVNGLSSWAIASVKPGAAGLPPEPLPEVVDEKRTLLIQAQSAFDAGRYAEPAGDNSIEISRHVLAQDPENVVARELVTRASQAYANSADQAMAAHDTQRALGVYRRLVVLFPDRSDYLKQVRSLEEPPLPELTGTWRVAAGELAGSSLVLNADGSYTSVVGKPPSGGFVFFAPKPPERREGHWRWADKQARTIELTSAGEILRGLVSADGLDLQLNDLTFTRGSGGDRPLDPPRKSPY